MHTGKFDRAELADMLSMAISMMVPPEHQAKLAPVLERVRSARTLSFAVDDETIGRIELTDDAG